MRDDLRSPFDPDFDRRDADRLATVFKALASPSRVQIIALLAGHPRGRGGSGLAREVGLNQETVSHHLGRLAAAGLVVGVRSGAAVPYRLDEDAVAAVADLIRPVGAGVKR